MKTLLKLVAFCTTMLVSAVAGAVASPEEVVKDTTEKVLARVRAEHDTLKADTGKLYGLVNELIIPHFDFVTSSRLVLGKYWRTADEATRARFVDAFKQLLVRTYANALFQYADEKIVYKPSTADGRIVVVRTEVTQQGAHPIPVHYRMHQSGGEWKTFDVFVDGISLVVTYRESFASQISQSGLDSLISQMEAKNQGLK